MGGGTDLFGIEKLALTRREPPPVQRAESRRRGRLIRRYFDQSSAG